MHCEKKRKIETEQTHTQSLEIKCNESRRVASPTQTLMMKFLNNSEHGNPHHSNGNKRYNCSGFKIEIMLNISQIGE